MNKKYSKRMRYQLPKEKENMKHATLKDINPVYQLYEDGSLFSRTSGKFIKSYISKGIQYYIIPTTYTNSKTSSFGKERLVKKYIIGKVAPQIEGVEHKPMLGYQGIYQIYSNGQVWSYSKFKWMTACLESRKKYSLYCLMDAEGNIRTEYVHRLLAENFILNKPIGNYQVHHKDHNPKNNSLDNLTVLAPLEHQQFHKENRAHSPQFLAKQAAKKAEKEKQKADKPKRVMTQQHKRKISEAQKRNWEKRKEVKK